MWVVTGNKQYSSYTYSYQKPATYCRYTHELRWTLVITTSYANISIPAHAMRDIIVRATIKHVDTITNVSRSNQSNIQYTISLIDILHIGNGEAQHIYSVI